MSGIFDQVINYAPPSLLKGTVTYKGAWSAATNTPTLINPPDSTTNGFYYVVSAAGTQFSLVFNIGDWIISNGSAWQKVDNTDAVDSVFGRTGAVVGVSTDYSAVGITNTALGASNPSTVAATTITATSTIAATGAVTGSNLSGTNTGNQTITLTGGVTGSGTGSFAATVVTNANLTGGVTSVGNAATVVTNANLTGDVTSSGNATTLTNAPVIAKVLTGYTSGAGTVAATDSILQAIQKLNGNDATNANLTGVITSVGNATSIASQTGTGTKFVVDTSPTLVTPNIGVATGTSLAAALNGTLGATTPSSVAATTGGFSGVLDVGAGGFTQGGYGLLNINGSSGGMVKFGTATVLKGSIYGNVGGMTYDTVGALVHNFYTNSVSRGTITDTGLNGMAIGATTPSTGAFSTLSSTGTYTMLNGATTRALFTADSSFLTIDSQTSNPIKLQVNTTTVAQINTTGAAITGTLSSTTGANFATSSGSVGIATTIPNYLLTVKGTSNASTPIISVTDAVSASGKHLKFGLDTSTGSGFGWLQYTHEGTAHEKIKINPSGGSVELCSGTTVASSTGLAITGTLSCTTGANFATSSGNVGIGTTSPAYKLQVQDAAGSILSWTDGTTPGTLYSGGGYVGLTFPAGTGGFFINTAGNFNTISTNGIERLRVDSSGNVGIGTASPAAHLHVYGSGEQYIYNQSTTSYCFFRQYPASGYAAFIENGTVGSPIYFRTSASTACDTNPVTISSTGLAVTGTVSTTGEMLTGVASQISSGKACIQFNGSTHNGLVFKETATASGASFVYFTRSDGNLIGSITRVTTTDAIQVNYTSDRRSKHNIRDFTDSGSLIDGLRPVRFDWNGDKENDDLKDAIGFIAQETHASSPVFARIGAITVGDDDPTTITKQWQRSDAALIPILVAELQSLRKRLAALESK